MRYSLCVGGLRILGQTAYLGVCAVGPVAYCVLRIVYCVLKKGLWGWVCTAHCVLRLCVFCVCCVGGSAYCVHEGRDGRAPGLERHVSGVAVFE